MFTGEANAHARTFCRADDFLSDSPVTELPKFVFLFCSHVVLITGFAVILINIKKLLNGLAFLANDLLIGITNALAFIRLRWVITANFSRNLAN